jgi:Domain of unknown function (DUF4440)
VRTPILLAGFTLASTAILFSETPDKAVLSAQQRWMDSYNQRDPKALSAIEADDFRITLGDGRVQTKDDQVTDLGKPLLAGAQYRIAVETSEVRMYGKAAVITGVVVETGKAANEQGAPREFRQRSRYTDTWILEGGRWRVVASHLCDVK